MKKVNELEKSLKKSIGKHRLIMAMAIVTGIITIAVFGVLFANSKKTLISDFSQPPITRVTYNELFAAGVLFGIALAIAPLALFLRHVFICRRGTVKAGDHYVTLYVGLLRRELYVDGELREATASDYKMQARLADGIMVYVNIDRSLRHARVSFSDRRAPVEL
ncbi:MAG: hypothetical protein QM208_01845 [Bacillota bacterium]|nr:hypothetical protein [Bacillota bacterium]